ncbi:MAG: acyl-CoA thioesterase [Acidobacteria bacterium]|nr:acyl-CoA thioesterase [Acidobacteriota bacterium]
MSDEKLLPPRSVRGSQSEIVQVVLPNDANPLGNILGGAVMHLVDMLAAVAAQRHCGSYVVTASVDHMDFRYPIRVGQIIVLKASVNRAFHCSMEVGVKVFREDNFTHQREHTSSAYLTFVAIDENRKPKPVPPVVPKTAEEKRRYREAGKRRRWRLEHLPHRRHPD